MPSANGVDSATALEVVRDFGPLVTSLCRSTFRDDDEARDAAQEAWVEVLASLPGFRGESKLGTWIYTIVYRKILRLKIEGRRRSLRELSTLRELRIEYHGPDFVAPHRSLPDIELWTKETCRDCMRGVLLCLDSDSRLVFVFRFVVELPYEEISRVMDKSEAAVRQIASRSRRLVARFLSGECGLVKPGATCHCRNDRWIRETGLAESFWRLSRMTRLADLYRSANKVFPKKNYWEKLLASSE